MTTATTARGTITIPEATPTVAHATTEQLDQAVADVAARKDDWLAFDYDERIELLRQTIHDTMAAAEDWAEAAHRFKGIASDSPLAGEEIAFGPMQLVRHARLLIATLTSLRDHGRVELPGEPYARDDGQVVVPVFPTSWLDKLTFVGHTGEVWMQPDVTLDTLETARVYHHPPEHGRVCFILGAGNAVVLCASDALHKLFAEQQTCVIKMNPAAEHLGAYIERSLIPLVREGLVRIVYGGVSQGQHLTGHPAVDTIHMTASDKTHDAVVFGGGDDAQARKADNRPVTDKEVTSELGACNPIIVVPGPWSETDLAYHGKHIASMVAANAGFACLCPRVIVTHAAWAKRRALLDQIRASFAEAPQRDAYYPGARERWEVFMDSYRERAETFGDDGPGCVPWTFIPGLDPTDTDQLAFRVEAFNTTTTETPLAVGRDIPTFLRAAVDLCNDHLWGTLSATILVHPKTLQEPGNAAAIDEAVARMRYGSIGVNVWGGTGYGLISTTWGAFPGHSLADIQSGRGVVHNTYLLHDPQKSVIHAPFRLGKKPPMSYDFRTFPSLSRRLLQLEANKDYKQLPGIVLDGVRA